MSDPADELTPEERQQVRDGFHGALAEQLRTRGRNDLAGWVLEQIWDWEGARRAYRDASMRVDALRVAVESGAAAGLDNALRELEQGGEPAEIDAAIALLRARRRPMEAARLLALHDDRPEARAHALLAAGDRLGAARVFADAGGHREALDVLAPPGSEPASAPALNLAAQLAWDLGDAEGAARFAQRALRAGATEDETHALLARALGSLGHDLAAQMVLQGRTQTETGSGVPGRYRVTGLGTSGLTGAAYAGFDRATLQEVEIHLLLSDLPDAGPIDEEVTAAMERFEATALAATAIGHPAIRPILRLEPHAGLLVLPRSEGTDLRSMIRPPGMARALPRARGLMAFLIEGLVAAHTRGLVHGWMLPSQIVCDAAGRPMLGPFGAHALAGLAATHTGALEEIMTITAPELRRGGQPTVQSDLYAAGALLAALLTGRLGQTLKSVVAGGTEFDLARGLMASDPAARPSGSDVVALLRRPVADVRDLDVAAPPEGSTTSGAIVPPAGELQATVAVTVAESWSDARLDALCGAANPWLQPILDRDERHLVLAPWPSGSRTLSGEAMPDWRQLVPSGALEFSEPELTAAIEHRLRQSSLVRTPSGRWMLALDDLLSR